jgi:hypothetical protein
VNSVVNSSLFFPLFTLFCVLCAFAPDIFSEKIVSILLVSYLTNLFLVLYSIPMSDGRVTLCGCINGPAFYAASAPFDPLTTHNC